MARHLPVGACPQRGLWCPRANLRRKLQLILAVALMPPKAAAPPPPEPEDDTPLTEGQKIERLLKKLPELKVSLCVLRADSRAHALVWAPVSAEARG